MCWHLLLLPRTNLLHVHQELAAARTLCTNSVLAAARSWYTCNKGSVTRTSVCALTTLV